jgi:hypothetical protein
MENSAENFASAYFVPPWKRASARLRRVISSGKTPPVSNRPAGLPGPEGRSALSHRPAGGGARAPPSGLVALAMPNGRSTAWACREGAYGRQTLSLRQAASRRVRPKATLAGSRWAGAGRRLPSRRCPHPCGVGSAAVHGRARNDHCRANRRFDWPSYHRCRDVVFWAGRDQMTSASLRKRRAVGCRHMFHGRIRNFPKRPSQKALRRLGANMFHAPIERLALSTKSP